jgi:hypothetical protein
MKITIKRLYDRRGNETGAILCAPEERTSDLYQKLLLEGRLIQYCVKQLYPEEILNVFRDTYMGVPSITVIRQGVQAVNEDISVVTH